MIARIFLITCMVGASGHAMAFAAACDVISDELLRQILKEPDSLKRILEARDARFDGIEIATERTERRLPDKARMFAGYNMRLQSPPHQSLKPVPIQIPEELTKRYRMRFVFNDGERTVEKTTLRAPAGGEAVAESDERLLWTNRHGNGKEQSLLAQGADRPTHSVHLQGPVSSIEHDWEFLQFSLGIGLGSKISRITAVSLNGDAIHFTAAADLSWWKGFAVTGKLDRTLIMREAVFTAKLDEKMTATVSVQTSGELSAAAMPCVSRKGTVKAFNSRGSALATSLADYDSEVVNVTSLTAGEYVEKTRFEVPEVSHVVDSTKPTHTVADDNAPERVWLHRVIAVVAMNVAALGFLGWWLIRRAKHK